MKKFILNLKSNHKQGMLIAAFLIVSSGLFAQTSVLVAGSPTTNTWGVEVQGKLQATGLFSVVDFYNTTTGTPTTPYLQGYSAIIVFTDAGAQDPILFGNNLATYIDGGGGVVSATFDNCGISIQGNYNTNTYKVLMPAAQTQGTQLTLGTILQPGHPVMQGVTSFNGGTSSYHSISTTLTTGSYRIADWSNGSPLITANDNVGPANVKRVDLNFYPPSTDSRADFWNAATDGDLIMANALLYVANGTPCTPTVTPTISCPTNITVNNDAGVCGAVVNYTAPIGTDDCGNATTTQTAGFASGATFPVGTTTNTYSVTNALGTATCSFTITVVDTEAPTIACPADITVNNGAGQCDAVVNYTTPVGSDNCSGVTVALTSGLASGATFPLGVSTITYTATDAVSNTSTPCSFTVTVVDAEIPTITCPANVSSCDTVVNGIAPVATADNCTGEYVTYTLSGATTGSGTTDVSGTIFNVGTTTVWYHVTDSAGNNDSCSFDVVIHPLLSILMNSFNTDTVCLGSNPMALPAVTPAGGTYAGPGVVGSTFNPDTAGVGTHYITYTFTDGNSCTDSDSAMIVVRSCVGINENASLNGVNIYPNPTNGLVHINLGNHNGSINYTLSTIEGRIVTQEQDVTAHKMTINLNNQSKGIYLLRIEDATSSKVYKVIKE